MKDDFIQYNFQSADSDESQPKKFAHQLAPSIPFSIDHNRSKLQNVRLSREEKNRIYQEIISKIKYIERKE
ncbi:MAG: hypothetical protein JXR07_19465 [Reichenbachiella sp.]